MAWLLSITALLESVVLLPERSSQMRNEPTDPAPTPTVCTSLTAGGRGGVISSYGIAIMSTSLGRAACLRDAWQLTLQDRGCLVRAACIGSHAFWPQPSMAALRHHRLSSRFCSCSTCSVVEDYFQGVFNLPSCTSVRRATSEQRAHV